MIKLHNLFKIPPSTYTEVLFDATKTDPTNYFITNIALKTLKVLLIFFTKSIDFTCNYKERTLSQKVHFVFNSLNQKKILVLTTGAIAIFVFIYKNRTNISQPEEYVFDPSSALEALTQYSKKILLLTKSLCTSAFSAYLKELEAQEKLHDVWSLKGWDSPLKVIKNSTALFLWCGFLVYFEKKMRPYN